MSNEKKDPKLTFNVTQIMEYQQNRYPLLFVDEITEAVPGVYAKGKKAFTFNEWYFPAHFAGDPNVPGFVQIETLVQVFLMTFLTLEENAGKKTSFVSLDKTRFKRKIIPGETMNVYAELASFKRGIATGFANGEVNREPAISASFTIAIPEVLESYRPSGGTDSHKR